jgi:Na+/pantothenate symporter
MCTCLTLLTSNAKDVPEKIDDLRLYFRIASTIGIIIAIATLFFALLTIIFNATPNSLQISVIWSGGGTALAFLVIGIALYFMKQNLERKAEEANSE